MDRFNEKSFAGGTNRQQIACCEEIGLSLEKFIEIAMKSMRSISKELDL